MNKDKIIHTIIDNKSKVISCAVLVAITIVIAIGANLGSHKADPHYGVKSEFKQVSQTDRVNELINSYFEYHSSNNIEELEKIAFPITDMEKSYIEFMSGYIEYYEIQKIYTKPGLSKDTFMASADVNIKFKEIDEMSPGLYFFYLDRDKKGELHIDNRYCIFNQEYAEEETNPEIQELITEFENQEDFIILQHDVNKRYNSLLESNEEYKTFITALRDSTINWYSEYQAKIEQAQAEAAAQAEAEAAAQAEAEAAAQAQAEAEAAQAETQEQPAAPAGGFSAGDTVTISETLNIREQPDENARIAGKVLANGVVSIIENSGENGWTKVDVNGRQGYIRTDLLR